MNYPLPARSSWTDWLQELTARRYPAIAAIVNLTPNSFFDGGKYQDEASITARIQECLAQGAEMLDLGAESSKPGAEKISPEEQWRRLQLPLKIAKKTGLWISVDTTSAQVAELALQAGADLINDISCLSEPELAEVCAHYDAPLILSHSRGEQSAMRGFSEWPDDDYQEVLTEVLKDWRTARDRAISAGLRQNNIGFDPGLGFSKNARHCWELMRDLKRSSESGTFRMLGASRKSFLASPTGTHSGLAASNRLGGSLAAALWAAEAGIELVRVDDVEETRQALQSWVRIRGA